MDIRKPLCPFCRRYEMADYTLAGPGVMCFEPLNPVTPGHMLFVPIQHETHPSGYLAKAMEEAEWYADGQKKDYNLITSSGKSATMTIEHIHVHYVPRSVGDGLMLPWSNQAEVTQGGPWTKHGHDIPGVTVEGAGRPTNRARCGGPGICVECSVEAARLAWGKRDG